MGISKTSIFLIFITVVTIFCGVVGFSLEIKFWDIPDRSISKKDLPPFDPLGGFLNALYKTVQLFVLNGPPLLTAHSSSSNSDALLNIARFLAPLSLAGAFISALARFWQPQISRLIMRWASKHTIVFGGGAFATSYLVNLIEAKKNVISVVNTKEQEVQIREIFGNTIHICQAETDKASAWCAVSISKAQNVILVDDSDQKNLAASRTIAQLSKSKNSTIVRVFSHIGNNQLRNELIRQTTMFETINKFRIEPFSVPELGARTFFQNRDFFYETIKRNYDRVHWLVYGMSEASFAFLSHFLTISPHPKLGSAKFTLVVEQADDIGSEFSQFIRNCGELADFEIVDPATFHTCMRTGDFSVLTSEPISAFLISGNNKQTLETALRLRGISQRDEVFKAPIYLSDFQGKDFDDTVFGHLTNGMHDEIDQIAKTDKICQLGVLIGSTDRTAEKFHHNYLATLKVRDPKAIPSHKNWDKLDENFRRANRRAADHAKTKFEAMNLIGHLELGVPASLSSNTVSTKLLEQLAKCEHESWMIDRILGGWKFSSNRDDPKRQHPNLVAYDKLDDTTKELDREQIRALFRMNVKQGEKTSLRQTVAIGLIGRNQISTQEAVYIYSKLTTDLIPKLHKDYPEHELAFFTPLAPGSDLVITQSVEAYFKSQRQSHQICIVKCGDTKEIVDAYTTEATGDVCWGLDNEYKPAQFSNGKSEVISSIENFAAKYELIDICPSKILSFPEKLSINSCYFASRIDVLVAFFGNSVANGPSGTNETIAHANNNGIPVIKI